MLPGCCRQSFVAPVVQRLCLYLVPDCIYVLFCCCIGGCGTPAVLGTVCCPFFFHYPAPIVVVSASVVAVSVIVVLSSVVIPVSAFRLVSVLPPDSFLVRLLPVPGFITLRQILI